MEEINFKGKLFPFVIVNMPFGKRKISTIELNESLMNENGSYVSETARLIDEEIFYFVKKDLLLLEEKELSKIIISEI